MTIITLCPSNPRISLHIVRSCLVLRETPRELNFNFMMLLGKKVIATAINNSATKTNYYSIPTSVLVTGGLDLTHVKLISVVVDSNATGGGAGSLYMYKYFLPVTGAATGTPSFLTNTPRLLQQAAANQPRTPLRLLHRTFWSLMVHAYKFCRGYDLI